MKRLAYILFLFLLVVAQATAQEENEPYEIDVVCQNAERIYRAEGDNGSTWRWMLFDSNNDPLPLLNEEGILFTGLDEDGNQIQGSEITITWNYVPGRYFLSVEQTSEFGCDSLQLGYVEVIEGPDAFEDYEILA